MPWNILCIQIVNKSKLTITEHRWETLRHITATFDRKFPPKPKNCYTYLFVQKFRMKYIGSPEIRPFL